ncbi:hypothetical protein BAUCODRAFT_40738, partial [Baudoinia panamericana UAMH 10762]
MGLTKTQRIAILLAIDIVFFFTELIIGYVVHSLALVADAFHMLNDVLSLLVGLWAVQVANRKSNSKMYTYGWQRAETLGALVNGVFLVALCVTIFLEAIQRFVDKPEVSQPKLILIVGCFGLASNIAGIFLFHDHSHGPGGHSHGEGEEHSHEHEHGDGVRHAEEGHAHAHFAEEGGNVADVLPEHQVAGWPKTQRTDTEGSEATAVNAESPRQPKFAKHAHSRSRSRAYSSFDDIQVNPSAFRKSIIDASRLGPYESEDDTEQENENAVGDDHDDSHDHADHAHEESALIGNHSNGYGTLSKRKSIDHKQHIHRQPKDASKGHGHSHGDLNMRGILLHVMGDALGNIGVIATALIIWLTSFPGRFYFDPAISLVITVIILASAIPLCKAASRILLQAVPIGINIDDITADIQDLPGILSCHHLHVWQLSDTKLVASLHVQVEFDFKDEGSARYMHLAQNIRECLHEYGIHSSTIQPEFCLDPDHDHQEEHAHSHDGDGGHGSAPKSQSHSHAGSVRGADACLLECGEGCGTNGSCCPP